MITYVILFIVYNNYYKFFRKIYIYVPLYISMIPKYLYDLNYFISIYKYMVFYIYYSYILL